MPIKSYIAVPFEKRGPELNRELDQIPGCRAYGSDEKRGIFIVVTDTPDEDADSALWNRLSRLGPLQHISLVSSFCDAESDEA